MKTVLCICMSQRSFQQEMEQRAMQYDGPGYKIRFKAANRVVIGDKTYRHIAHPNQMLGHHGAEVEWLHPRPTDPEMIDLLTEYEKRVKLP